jgi:ABC-type iron transport system FetAB ATPase subunit
VSFFTVQQLYFLDKGPVDLAIEASEIIGLYGVSGSGKSRLLRALADLDEHQGVVSLDSVQQAETSAHLWRRQVGLLPAETSWWLDSVGEHFNDFSNVNAVALGFTDDIAQWPVSRLSSGEKQRLGLMRLIENNPAVLLLDEPTANLDPQNTQLFEQFVMQYVQNHKASAIWVSHDQSQLHRIAHRCFSLRNGQLMSDSETT